MNGLTMILRELSKATLRQMKKKRVGSKYYLCLLWKALSTFLTQCLIYIRYYLYYYKNVQMIEFIFRLEVTFLTTYLHVEWGKKFKFPFSLFQKLWLLLIAQGSHPVSSRAYLQAFHRPGPTVARNPTPAASESLLGSPCLCRCKFSVTMFVFHLLS